MEYADLFFQMLQGLDEKLDRIICLLEISQDTKHSSNNGAKPDKSGP